MNAIGATASVIHQPKRDALRFAGSGLVAFGVFLSGFVIAEPAPYELFMALLIGVWFIIGLPISRTTGVLLAFMLTFMTGGFLSLTQMASIGDAPDPLPGVGVGVVTVDSFPLASGVVHRDLRPRWWRYRRRCRLR